METRKLIFILTLVIFLCSCERSTDNGKTPKIPGNPTTTFNKKILDGLFVTAIAFDSKGNAWVGTFKQGLIKYNSHETIIYDSSNSTLPNNLIIWDIKIDSKDNVWMGCNGLLKFDGTTFTLYNSENSLIPEDFVYSVAIDSKDNIWFTSCRFRQGGIVKYDGSIWKTYTPDNSDLPANFVHSIAIDKNDNVWLALGEIVANSYLVRISNNKWTTYTQDNLGFSPYYLGNIQINSENEVCASVDYSLSSTWVNSGPQVFVFDGNSALQLQFDSITKVKCITVDNEDNIWCNTYNGFAVYNWDKWVVNDTIFKEIGSFTIGQSKDKKIWIGTGDGIFIND